MLKFFRGVLATIVGLIIFSLLVLLIGSIVVGVITSEDEVEVEENTVLHLKLTKPIAERESQVPLSFVDALPGADAGVHGLMEILQTINHAKDNDNIKGIYLEVRFVQAGYATLKEIRDALEEFKSNGKWIMAYNEVYAEKDYYLSSVADEIYLNPVGALELNGLVQETVFLKGTMEKLQIEPQVFRVGEFKSAVEPFIRKEMSEANREQTRSFLNSIYNVFLDDVSRSRGIDRNELELISDEMQVRTPEDAERLKVVDGLAYFDKVQNSMRQRLGIEEDADITYIKYNKYKKSIGPQGNASNRIAVIVASGEIVSGEGEPRNIGSDKFAAEIRKARENDRVKAVVLRINSPGGSALASDVIWREIELTSREKPIIASMSDLAASGGYYLAMACDTIVAQPSTITGSIGIFGVIFNLKGFLNDKLGVTTDVVETGELSNLLRVTAPLTEFEKSIIQQAVEEGYETFTRKAAEGRDMPVEQLRSVASGRVWSGVEAEERNLVDILGSFDDAVRIAAEKAGLEKDDYRLRFYPEQKNFIEQIVEQMTGNVEAKAMEMQYGDFYPYVKQLREFKKYEGIQARMPYDIHID